MRITTFTSPFTFVVILFLIFSGTCQKSANARSVHIALHASWNATSPGAEAVKHIYDVWGAKAAVEFMVQFAKTIENDDRFTTDEFLSLSEKDERELTFNAVSASSSYSSLAVPTLRWTLSSRVHSPHVQFQYSLARRALALFLREPASPISSFAVLTSASRDSATLLLHPDEITSSKNALSTIRYPPPELAPRTGDHIPISTCITPGSDNAAKPILVLYAHLPHPSYSPWIRAVVKLAETCSHQVVFRFTPPVQGYPSPRSYTPLSGFAASVTLRSTEYNVVDDRSFSTRLFQDCPPGLSSSDCATRHTDDDNSAPFSWTEPTPNPKNASLSYSTASKFVLSRASGDIDLLLESLALVTEDAPTVLRSSEYLTGGHVGTASDKSFESAVKAVRSVVGDDDLVMLNGFKIDLVNVRQGASKLLRCLTAFSSASTAFLSTSTKQSAIPLPVERPDSPPRFRVLLPVEEKAPNALVWFNDIFSDSRYSRWPALNLSSRESVESFANKVEKQRLRSIPDSGLHMKLVKTKAHHLQLLLVVDPGDTEHLPFLSIPESIVRADLPIRVGTVLVPNGRTSEIAAAVFYHFLRLKGRRVAAQYIGMLRQVIDYVTSATDASGLSEMMVNMAFQQIGPQVGSPYTSALHVYKEDEDVKRDLEEGKSFGQEMRLYIDSESSNDLNESETTKQVSFLCLLNGIVIKDIGREIISLAVREQERISTLLSTGVLEGENVDEVHSDRWVKSDESVIVVNRLSRDMRSGDSPRSGNLPKKSDIAPVLAKDIAASRDDLEKISYFSSDAGEDFNITVWLAGTHRDSDMFSKKEEILKQLSDSEFAKQIGIRAAVLPISLELHGVVVAPTASNGGDDSVIVINGRRVFASAVDDLDDLIVEVASEFEKTKIPSTLHGDVRLLHYLYENEIAKACRPERGGEKITPEELFRIVKDGAKSISLPVGFEELDDRENPPSLTVLSVIDPTSPNAYVAVSVLQALKSAFSKDDIFMGIVVAPGLSTMKKKMEPPNTYFKFLLRSDDLAEGTGNGVRFGSRLSFDRLPQGNVLTVAVEPPRAWFVSSFMTNYDMDNVILENVSQDLDLFTEYQLVNLIVEGSCVDETGRPPQGLKLLLANEVGVTVDTLVMANLGYFQLKVPVPGIWWLSLARGPSSKIFMLRSMEMFKDNARTSFEADSNGRVPIPVESLSGAGGILLHVTRRPGMEGKSVLDPEGASETKGEKAKSDNESRVVHRIKNTVRNLFGRKTPFDEDDLTRGNTSHDDTINVFSVASGHLYERFLKIMISSVTKNASRKVKFWLLENYLSPAFKKLLPEFAKEHGAEVGMVTYRWPGWLRAQKEKQRIIWAYKILFLDVLFPLDVGRIIFVDSDQVIRGDVAELMDIDLKGAPYGYVPFCDSRKEVEGYRFWKTGFWKDTLQGAKYRISALYVVDLNRFRETAAGDTLRYIYQSLSADPNSLSNLDQDLPNYASVASVTGTTVPIFDLPEEWLWCETWCDDESKSRAKAIDLCNNPMTKVPKLDSAKKIISEWVDLDNRASELTEVIYKRLLAQEQNVNEAEDDSKTEL